MSDMLLWFSVVLVLFAIGDLIASKTKAKVSAVFVTLLLFDSICHKSNTS